MCSECRAPTDEQVTPLGVYGRRVECGERALEIVALQAQTDEDEARAAVAVRPGIEMHRRMDDVLHAVQEQRPRRTDVEEPFDAEDLRAARLQEHRQPDAE